MSFCNVGTVLFLCSVSPAGHDELSSRLWNSSILDGFPDRRHGSVVNFLLKGCSVWGECDSESRSSCFGKTNGNAINIFSSCGHQTWVGQTGRIMIPWGTCSSKKKMCDIALEFNGSVSEIVQEWNGHLEIFSRSQATQNSRHFILLWTDILQKTIVGCPLILLSFATLT